MAGQMKDIANAGVMKISTGSNIMVVKTFTECAEHGSLRKATKAISMILAVDVSTFVLLHLSSSGIKYQKYVIRNTGNTGNTGIVLSLKWDGS